MTEVSNHTCVTVSTIDWRFLYDKTLCQCTVIRVSVVSAIHHESFTIDFNSEFCWVVVSVVFALRQSFCQGFPHKLLVFSVMMPLLCRCL